MKKVTFKHLFNVITPLAFISCSLGINDQNLEIAKITKSNQHVKSGTIEIGFSIPTKNKASELAESNRVNSPFEPENIFKSEIIDASFACINNAEYGATQLQSQKIDPLEFAPLVGFFPLSIQFKPADNEVWMQIVKEKNQIEVYKGKELIKSISAEGSIALAPGEYPLQHKQRNPLWYAPDEYFSKRELRVPPRGDHFRYRRGALGNYAVYPTMDFVIHSGPFWSEEVGGLKVSEADLASIFVMLYVGTPVIVK